MSGKNGYLCHQHTQGNSNHIKGIRSSKRTISGKGKKAEEEILTEDKCLRNEQMGNMERSWRERGPVEGIKEAKRSVSQEVNYTNTEVE